MSGDEAREAMKRAAPVLCRGFGSIGDGQRLFEYTCLLLFYTVTLMGKSGCLLSCRTDAEDLLLLSMQSTLV